MSKRVRETTFGDLLRECREAAGKQSDKSKIKEVERYEDKCPHCGYEGEMDTIKASDDSGSIGVFPKCPKCKQRTSDIALHWESKVNEANEKELDVHKAMRKVKEPKPKLDVHKAMRKFKKDDKVDEDVRSKIPNYDYDTNDEELDHIYTLADNLYSKVSDEDKNYLQSVMDEIMAITKQHERDDALEAAEESKVNEQATTYECSKCGKEFDVFGEEPASCPQCGHLEEPPTEARPVPKKSEAKEFREVEEKKVNELEYDDPDTKKRPEKARTRKDLLKKKKKPAIEPEKEVPLEEVPGKETPLAPREEEAPDKLSKSKTPKTPDDSLPERPEEDELDADKIPPPPDEVVPDAAPIEARKEYLGRSEDVHFYFLTVEGDGGAIEDFVITDQEGIKKYSAKDKEIPVSEEGIGDFLIKVYRDVEITQIERSIYMKYIYPELLKLAPEEEEMFGAEEEAGVKKEGEQQEEEVPEFAKKESKKLDEKKFEMSDAISLLEFAAWKLFSKTTDECTPEEYREVKNFVMPFLEYKDAHNESKELEESYGNVYIEADIKRGLSKEQIVKKIQDRYSHIGAAQAAEIYDAVESGGDAPWENPRLPELEKEEKVKEETAVEKCKKKVKETVLIELKITDDEENSFDVHIIDDGTEDTVMSIGEREFRFSPEFTSMWRDEVSGVLSEEGVKEIALAKLADLDETEYNELLGKTAEAEVEVDQDIDIENENENLEGDNDMNQKLSEFTDEQLKEELVARKLEGINPKKEDSEAKKIEKLAEEADVKEEIVIAGINKEEVKEEKLEETDVAKGAKALVQLLKDAVKAGDYAKAAEYATKAAEIEAMVPPEAEAEAEKEGAGKDSKPDKPADKPKEELKKEPKEELLPDPELELESKDDEIVDEAKDKDKVAKAKKEKEAKAKKDKKEKEAKAKKDKKDKEDKAKKDKDAKAKKESKIKINTIQNLDETKGIVRLKDLLNMEPIS